MLSAFSHQLQHLSSDLKEQKQDLEDLKQKFKKEVEEANWQDNCKCKNMLDSIQSQVKENIGKIKDLSDKFDQLQFEKHSNYEGTAGAASQSCSEMDEHSSPFVDDVDIDSSPCFSPTWKAPGSREGTAAPIADGYESPPIGSPAKEFFAAASFVNQSQQLDFCGDVGVGILHTKQPMMPRKLNPWSFDNPKIKEAPAPVRPTPQNCDLSMSNESVERMSNNATPNMQQSSQFSVDNVTSIAAENCHLKQQIVVYRQKVAEVEQKLHASEAIVADLHMIREHFVQKEREWIDKQEWYEHKLKLLKQDKRRRGETIGKLLKCIDDCRDAGRLDESRAKEGKAVLNATLHTRGMHPEDRIYKVVESVELDRVPRAPQDYPEPHSPDSLLSSPLQAPIHMTYTNNQSNQNKNNSSLLCFCGEVNNSIDDVTLLIDSNERNRFIVYENNDGETS